MNITGCVITKDEETNIEKCLNSLKEITSEIIVVDTGSSDNTVQIARDLGAFIYHFEWENDFSKAKNYALSKATGDWIIFLDADEYIEQHSLIEIKNCVRIANTNGYDGIISSLINYNPETTEIQSTVQNLRIFRRDSKIKYFGAIHETIKHVTKQLKVIDFSKQISLIHTGYSSNEIERKQKGQRNLLLLLAEEKKNMNNHDINFYLSETYNLIKEYELALFYALKAHTVKETELLGTKEKNYLNIIRYLRKLEYPSEQVIRIIQEASYKYPSYPDYYVYIGDYNRFSQQFLDAIYMYEKALFLINNISQGETQTSGLLLSIYKQLSNLYYHTNDTSKTVHVITLILNTDRYDFSLLNYLMKILLINREDETNIINFLEKIYRVDVAKDLIYLSKSAINNGSYILANYFMSLLRSFSSELQEEELELAILNEDYVIASQQFLSLFHMKDSELQYLKKAIISSLLSKDETTKNKVFQTAYKNTGIDLKELLDEPKNNQYSQEELELVLDIIKEFYRLSKYEEIDKVLKKIKNDEILLATAELFYQNKNFGLALHFFDEYLQNKTEVEDELYLNILCKSSDSLYQIGELEIAEKYIENAYSISQKDYFIYSLWLKILMGLKFNERIIEVAKIAVDTFPDSNYFISILESLGITIQVREEEKDTLRSILYSETYLQRLDDTAADLIKVGKDHEAMPIIRFLSEMGTIVK
ncbi:glycosyltransferase family 2 protein [Paenibacillus sp. NRS-1760]|uniref:glycosyltransferase family 2 protein n=1 Tax=Paenibacillus sp. NRS-1760 TaxID=3233902 RepID=UPI003D286234